MSARALLASPLAFLLGVSLGALGGGGSVLAVPVLVFVVGQTPAAATSTSLVVVAVASVVGAHRHWRRGRVRLGTGVGVGLMGIAGSFAGTGLNRRLDGDVLLLAFSGVVVVAAWRIAAGCPGCTRAGEAPHLTAGGDDPDGHGTRAAPTTRVRDLGAAAMAKIVAAGTAVGFLTGLFGVGGGFVVVPALVLGLRFPMTQAVGTSLVVIAVNTAVALAARLGSGTIDWGTTAVFAAAATVGVGAGNRLADRLAPETMQRGFAAMLVVVGLSTAARALLALL